MPELPEVEMRRRVLEETSLGRRIERVAVLDERILDNVGKAELGRGLKGASLLDARRRGKYLFSATDNGDTLLMHFGMTGDLFFREKGGRRPVYSRVELRFDDGSCLHYVNMRLIGKVALYPKTRGEDIPDVARLGPEPLSRGFSFKRFKEIVTTHRTTIHQLLMEQGLIAGIGNIYSDEITFQAGVRPDRRTPELSEEETRRIFEKTKWTLRRAVEWNAELDGHAGVFIIPNRKAGGRCPRSRHELERIKIAGRSSYFCPACQR